MKNLFAIIIAAFIACAPASAGRDRGAIPRHKILSIVDEYRDYEGVNVLKVGSLGTSALRAVAKLAIVSEGVDEDARTAMKLINGVRSFMIVDYDDCNPGIRERLGKRLERLFRNYEPIMEFKDDGDIVRFYGVMNDKTGEIKDLVLYVPTDGALICVFGKIAMEKAMELVAD